MFVTIPRTIHPTGRRPAAWGAWAVVGVAWGLTYEWVAVGATWAPLLFTALRYSLAGLILIVLAGPKHLPGLLRIRILGRLAAASALMFVIGNGILVWALQPSPDVNPDPGIVAVTIAMIPIYTSALTALRPGRHRSQPAVWAGLLLGLTGVAVLSVRFGAQAAEVAASAPQVPLFLPTSVLIVQAALQLGCIAWAAGSLCAAGLSRSMPPLILAGGQMTIAGLLLSTLAAIHGDPFVAPLPSARVVTALLCLTLVGSVIGYSCYAFALKQLSVTNVSLHAYVNPIVALVAASLLHERVYGPRDVIAILMILAGVTFALTSDARNRSAAPDDRAVTEGGINERVRVSLPQ